MGILSWPVARRAEALNDDDPRLARIEAQLAAMLMLLREIREMLQRIAGKAGPST